MSVRRALDDVGQSTSRRIVEEGTGRSSVAGLAGSVPLACAGQRELISDPASPRGRLGAGLLVLAQVAVATRLNHRGLLHCRHMRNRGANEVEDLYRACYLYCFWRQKGGAHGGSSLQADTQTDKLDTTATTGGVIELHRIVVGRAFWRWRGLARMRAK